MVEVGRDVGIKFFARGRKGLTRHCHRVDPTGNIGNDTISATGPVRACHREVEHLGSLPSVREVMDAVVSAVPLAFGADTNTSGSNAAGVVPKAQGLILRPRFVDKIYATVKAVYSNGLINEMDHCVLP